MGRTHRLLAALWVGVSPSAASAATPVWHWLTVDDGLDPEAVFSLAQSTDGRIWIGTSDGVKRWDGVSVETADEGLIGRRVTDLVALDDGAVAALATDGRIWRLSRGEVELLPLAPGESGFRDCARDGLGRLVAVGPAGLVAWETDGWVILSDDPAMRRAGWMERGPEDSLLVADRGGWSQWRPTGVTPFARDSMFRPFAAVALTDGTVWIADQHDQVRHVSAVGEAIETWTFPHDPEYMVARGDELWVHTNGVLRGRIPGADGRVSEVTIETPSAGPLLVDEEGSLWVGTLRGLGLLREPGALELTDRVEGPRLAGRSVQALSDEVWLGSWQRSVRYRRADGRVESLANPRVTSRICTGSDGIAWGVSTPIDGVRHYVAMGGEPATELAIYAAPGGGFHDGCGVDPDGRVWFASAGSLWRTQGSTAPSVVSPLPFTRRSGAPTMLTFDGDRLWIAQADQACGVEASVLAQADVTPRWDCHDVPDGHHLRAMALTERGNLWGGSETGGAYRLTPGGFEPIPGSRDLPTLAVRGMRPSPSGGVWILGPSVVLRVSDQPDDPAGWRVEEPLSMRIGHLANSAVDIAEDPDGTLWLAGAAGLTTVPGSARKRRFDPPRVYLANAEVDGLPVQGYAITLPRPESHVRLRFVSPSYREPRLLRYRMRLDGRGFSSPTQVAQFDVANLGPGTHTIEVQATLDQVRWSAEPAIFTVTVPQPWYARWQTWVALVALLASLVVALLMVRQRLRLGVETLRTRISMDLHDEVGAGLASMGLLGGLLREDIPDEAHAQIVDRLVATSGELGGALRAIVWSLQPSSLRMGALGVYLEDRARGIFGELAMQQALTIERPPETLATKVGLDVLRAIQLIALEALHNAARHAQATEVRLRLVPAGRDRWRLTVEDDGVGMTTKRESSVDSGHGLQSMARRAQAIGAVFRVDSGELGGTRVWVEFSPRARQQRS